MKKLHLMKMLFFVLALATSAGVSSLVLSAGAHTTNCGNNGDTTPCKNASSCKRIADSIKHPEYSCTTINDDDTEVSSVCVVVDKDRNREARC